MTSIFEDLPFTLESTPEEQTIQDFNEMSHFFGFTSLYKRNRRFLASLTSSKKGLSWNWSRLPIPKRFWTQHLISSDASPLSYLIALILQSSRSVHSLRALWSFLLQGYSVPFGILFYLLAVFQSHSCIPCLNRKKLQSNTTTQAPKSPIPQYMDLKITMSLNSPRNFHFKKPPFL